MRSTIKKFVWFTAVLWTLAVFGFFAKDALHLRETIQDLARAEACAYYNKDQAARMWATAHGGIYVPVSDKTPPNPYLAHLPERDIVTATGKHLTLMNPSYMSRLMMEHYSTLFGVKAHITSLHYFRTETAPDAWEEQALVAFENGRPEVMEVSEIEGESFLRLIRPIKTEESCLKCHQDQGHAIGNIHGGVSVSIPMKPYLALWRKEITTSVFTFALLWIMGFSGLLFYNKKISHPVQALERTEASLRASQENYRILAENSLTGIYVIQNDRVVFANSEFARIHGYALDEILGQNHLRFIQPEDRPIVEDRVKRRFQGLPLPNEYRIRGLTKNGATIYVQRRITLTSYNGLPAIIGNEIDVTSQMVAEAELAASESQLQRLADGLIELREVEHERFARDIHENIAQCLSAIKFQVESAIDDSSSELTPEARDTLRTTITDVQHTLVEIHKIARQYSPIILKHIGIIKGLGWLCTQFTSVCPKMDIENAFQINESDIPDALKILIFRMVEQILHSLSSQPDATAKIGVELVSDKIVFYLKTNVSTADLTSSPPEGYLQGELALIALKRRIEKFGGSFLLSSDRAGETLLIATWDTYCKYPSNTPAPGIGNPSLPGLS